MTDIPIPVEIGKPASRALAENGYTNLAQLADVHEKELMQLHGVGPKAIKVIKLAFKKHNIPAVML